jgi:hypothetical protein
LAPHSPLQSRTFAELGKILVLNPRNLAAIYQCYRANHHCLLRSSGDADLIWIAARASASHKLPTPYATQDRHGLRHTGADALLFVRELVL